MQQAVLVIVVAALPVFLVGALAVQLGPELGLGASRIGLASAVSFTMSGVVAKRAGVVVQHVGAQRSMAVAASLSALSMAVLGFANGLLMVLVAMSIGGAANAGAQPAANLRIARAISHRHLGLAIGLKQSAIPFATMFAGLAVPGMALTIGWRWACFAGASTAVLASVTLALGDRDDRSRSRVPAPYLSREAVTTYPRSVLIMITIGGGLGTAASTGLGIFLVSSAVSLGFAAGQAGVLFAACSLVGLVGRVGLGWLADQGAGRFVYLVVSSLLLAGAIGYLLLSAHTKPLFAVGAVIAYGTGWTITGLLHYAVVRDNADAPAVATGALQTGLSLGAAMGPLAFGLLADGYAFTTAWTATAIASCLGALIVWLGRMGLAPGPCPGAKAGTKHHRSEL